MGIYQADNKWYAANCPFRGVWDNWEDCKSKTLKSVIKFAIDHLVGTVDIDAIIKEADSLQQADIVSIYYRPLGNNDLSS